METTNPTTNNNVVNNKPTTIVSSIKGLPVAKSDELVQEPASVQMKFLTAELTMEKESGKTWIKIHVEGLSVPLFRNVKQVQADLSNYIDRATSVHLQPLGLVSALNKHFAGKNLIVKASAYEAGSKYIVDENSTAFKNNIATIGEELVAESAGVRIDGIINAPLSKEENDALYEAQLAFAMEQASKASAGTAFAID